ncbi:unnamed protein product [Pylaiella littoralis]
MAKRGECVTQRLCCAFVLVALSMSTVTSTTWSAPPDGISRLPCFLASTSTHQRAAASAPRPTLTTTSTDNLHRHHRRILLILSPPASHRKSEQALLPWSSRFPSAVSRQKCGAIGVSSPDTISTSLSRRKSTRRCWRSRSNGNTPRSIAATALNGVAGGAAAAAAGSETRTGEGAAAAAAATAGAVEGRPGGHNSTTSSCRDGGGGRSSDGNPSVPPAACTGGERWGREEQRVGRRSPGRLSRGIAATERFFTNGSRRNRSRLGGSDRGNSGIVEKRTGAAAVTAAAKLEGEKGAREEEGLRGVPRHVAFIMDGNGRWAAERNMPRRAGHVEGARRAGEAVEACRQLGVEFVTLYAFSTENWNRPAGEVSFIMDLMEKTLLEQRDGLRRNGIRLTAIGELHRLPARLRSLLEDIQKDNSGTGSSSNGEGSSNSSSSHECSSSDSSGGRTDGGATGAEVPDDPPSISIPVAAVVGAREAEGGRLIGAGEGPGAESEASTAALAHTRNSGSGSGSEGGGGCGGGEAPSRQAPPPPPQLSPSPPTTTTPTPTMTLCLAVSYGGRSELAAAARELAVEAAAGRLDPESIDESALGRHLSTARLGIPDPDLVVRTSGESRLSNLLVWQSAYSELHVVGKAWPDFRRPDLVEAFRDYGRRRRRFGKTPEQMTEA